MIGFITNPLVSFVIGAVAGFVACFLVMRNNKKYVSATISTTTTTQPPAAAPKK